MSENEKLKSDFEEKYFLILELNFCLDFLKMLQKDLLKVEFKFLLWVSLHFWLLIKSLNLFGLETFSKFGFLGLPFWFHFYAMMSIWQKLLNLHRFLKSVWIFFVNVEFLFLMVEWKIQIMTLQMKVNGENFTPQMNFSWIKNAHANWKRVKIM